MESEVSNSALKEVYGDCLEEGENPLSVFATQSLETTFITDTPCSIDFEEVITVATGEGKNPASVLTGTYWEELTHLHLFPSGKYGCKVQRDIPLSASKYFNQLLLDYSQVFVADSDCNFLAHSVMQKTQLNSQINNAMRKVVSNISTAGMLNESFKSTVKQFIA